ncbi:hypothetical protein AVEN_251163-1 [Araneus ventricosus]|uniref:Uncharacterized protein n=1 Tax=Araneus ventricosus TaxID=182803 RepID=A0A4Y2I8B0_ARAVE|nr:hypothetical protein AVEN_251163-1 [Araneus ventricosus]
MITIDNSKPVSITILINVNYAEVDTRMDFTGLRQKCLLPRRCVRVGWGRLNPLLCCHQVEELLDRSIELGGATAYHVPPASSERV